MAYSVDEYVGDGSRRDHTLSFPYISMSHVKAEVNDAPVTFTWLSNNQIRLNEVPENGVKYRIFRQTPTGDLLADFQDGSLLDKDVLDIVTLQNLYVSQETFDKADGTTSLAGTYRDQAKVSADSAWNSKEDAAASKDSAHNSDVSAAGFATAAAGYRDTAKTYMDAAAVSKNAAKVSENAAKASEEQASTYQAQVTAEGTKQVNAVKAESITQVAKVTAQGDSEVDRISNAGAFKVGQVTDEGTSQINRVQAEGTTQDNRVLAQGNDQVARLSAMVDSLDTTKSVRQVALEIPDMIPVNAVGVAANTENWVGSVRFPEKNSVVDMGVDCLTGSRGGMALFANTGSYNHYITTSLLHDVGKFAVQTSGTGGSSVPGFIARPLIKGGAINGPETWDGYEIPTANLLYQMTTHRSVDTVNGAVWHYNPITGFAMCKYEGTGEAMTIKHPMGRKPLILNVKNLGISSNWVSWVGPDNEFMYFNQKNGPISASSFFATPPTETEIYLGSSNWLTGYSTGHLLWGYFGDSLEDIFPGMMGVRGSTAVFRIPASSGNVTIDTGIEDIKAIIRKPLVTDHWTLHLATAGWDKYTITNQVLGETAGYTGISVDGSQVTFQNDTRNVMFIVIGSKMENPSTVLHQAHQGVTHYGNAQTDYELNLGHDFVSGDNGGMVMGRNIEAAGPEFLFDTIGAGTGHLVPSETYSLDDNNNIQMGWTTKGVKLSNSGYINAAAYNQYLVWGTTHKKTIDGIEWQYNPATGFGMAQFTGNGVLGRKLRHPLGNIPGTAWFKAINDGTVAWVVFHTGSTAQKYWLLDQPCASATTTAAWNDEYPTAQDFTLGNGGGSNEAGVVYNVYMWATVPGVAYHGVYRQASTTPVTIETGIEDIETIMIKDDQKGGLNVFTRDQRFGKWHSISDTDPHADNPVDWIKVDGSKVITQLADNYNYQLISVFSNTVKGGRDSHIQIPANPTKPVTVNFALGFNEDGQQDRVISHTTPLTVDGGGFAGTRYVYMTPYGNLHTTSQRPTYVRSPYPLAGWSFSIPLMRMYYEKNQSPAVFLGEYKVDVNGNVYDLVTYATGDIWVSDEFWAESDSLYHFPQPWGHTEVELLATSTRHDIADDPEVNEQWLINSSGKSQGSHAIIYNESIALYTASEPSFRRTGGMHYKLKARRLF